MTDTDKKPALIYHARDYLKDPPRLGRYGTFYGNNLEARRSVTAKDGTTLNFEVYESDPKRPWAVCVHSAIYGHPADFTPYIDMLRETHNIILPTLRGHDASVSDTLTISTKLLNDDLLRVLTSVTDTPADFIFATIGSPVGFSFAANHPEKVRHIAFIGGYACTPNPNFEKIPLEGLRAIDPSFFEFLSHQMGKDALKTMVRVYARWIATECRADKSIFTRIRVPTFLIAPDHDPYLPLPACIEAYRYIPGARLYVWPGNFDDNDPDLIAQFCKSVVRFFMDRL